MVSPTSSATGTNATQVPQQSPAQQPPIAPTNTATQPTKDSLQSANPQSTFSWALSFITSPLYKVWSFVSSPIWATLNWLAECLGFGNSAQNLFESIADAPEATAAEIAKSPIEYGKEFFEIILKNPKVVRDFMRDDQNKVGYDKFITALQAELHKNQDAHHALNSFDKNVRDVNAQALLRGEMNAVTEALVQTSKDIGSAIIANNEGKAGNLPDRIVFVKHFFDEVLPNYLKFETEEEFQAFFDGIASLNDKDEIEGILDFLINNAPERSKAEMKTLQDKAAAGTSFTHKNDVINLFRAVEDLGCEPLTFEWVAQLQQNLLLTLPAKFYTDLSAKVKSSSEITAALLDSISEQAKTKEGRIVLKDNLNDTLHTLISHKDLAIQKPKNA